ncbi:MAG: hypothetical protein IKI91_00635 [Clostridia bacterium]|nr:hypothetical protein [Clostridia bacterium]
MTSPLIVKWRYWNNRSVREGRSGNYLRYIGTRDGVEKLTDKTYLDYIGTRPRVEKNGAHGLFSDDDEPIIMDKAREHLNQHDGTVHTLIVSLSREDAEATGFNCAARWRSFMRSQKLALARQFYIPPESLRWYGAFHNEGSHPHIHVLLYSEDPTHPGYLKQRGLEQIKRDFATEIFRHELDSIYQRQTAQRDELTQIARDEIRDLVMEMRGGEVDPELARRMRELSEKLKTVKGKKVYGYLPPEVKQQVNEIVDLLSEDERVRRLYDLWYESRTAILRSYTKHIPPQKPLSQEETFKPIRNAVIREAMKIGTDTQTESQTHRFLKPGEHRSQSPFMAAANLFANVAGIFEDRIDAQLKLHPELSVDSKVRREQWAKDHGVNLTM